MAPAGGGGHHMGASERMGVSGGEDSYRDEDGISSERPRATGARSTRGRARRKGLAADEVRFYLAATAGMSRGREGIPTVLTTYMSAW